MRDGARPAAWCATGWSDRLFQSTGRSFCDAAPAKCRSVRGCDPPLSWNLRDSGENPFSVGAAPMVRGWLSRDPLIPVRSFCLSVSGGRLRLRRRLLPTTLSRAGWLGRGYHGRSRERVQRQNSESCLSTPFAAPGTANWLQSSASLSVFSPHWRAARANRLRSSSA